MGLGLAEPGFHTRAFVEWEEYPRNAIFAAQRAGYFAPAPIWDDLTTFDARPLAGAFDTLLAGYPCQPFSQAGQRRGEADERHLWPDVARVIRELGPGLEWIFLENVAGHVSLGAETVLRELREMGFTPAAGLFSAAETGAAHERLRWFCVAHKPGRGQREQRDAAQPGCRGYADGGGEHLADGLRDRACSGGQPSAPHQDAGREGRRGCAQSGDAGGSVANSDGRNASAEREQRGGEQRFQPQSGTDGAGSVDNAAGARCDGARIGAEADSQGRERLSGDGCTNVGDTTSPRLPQPGQPGQPESGPQGPAGMVAEPQRSDRTMADAHPAGREPGHEGPERSRRDEPGRGGELLADASAPRLQGREQPGSSGERDRAPADGSASERGRPWLHPPGPADREAWAAVLAADASRAPSFSRRDVKEAAIRLAALLTPEQAEAIVQRAGDMAFTDLLAEVVSEAGWLVDQTAAFAGLCDLAHGMAQRSRALRLLGNGVFPLAAAHAWRTLSAAHGLGRVDLGATSAREAGTYADESLGVTS
jgi:site-specific DNA-cytosine methylase